MDTPANSNYNAQVEEQVDGLVRIYSEDIELSFKNHLTKSDYWVWMYLTTCRVFADDDPDKEPIFTKIPTITEIATRLDIHKKTAKNSLRKLKQIGILSDFIGQIRQ